MAKGKKVDKVARFEVKYKCEDCGTIFYDVQGLKPFHKVTCPKCNPEEEV
jgi:DNA-directed RNA polymerase subunit RPC12/RpoP